MKFKLFSIWIMLIALCVFLPQATSAHNIHKDPISDSYNSYIIDDVTFTAKDAMTEAQIQTFLASSVSGGACDRWKANPYGSNPSPPWYCLYETNNPNTNGKAPSKIIYEVAQEVGLNPQVILVTLQKENSLITDNWPWPVQYETAMGMGCPEGGPCDPTKSGFENQVREGARLLKSVYNASCNPGGPNYGYDFINTRRGTYRTLDGKSTYIGTCATAALYQYTPHRPDSAYLTATDGSHYYGNYNFVYFFYRWFGVYEIYDYESTQLYRSGPYAWNAQATKFVANGDFDNDGKQDIAAMYNYGNGNMGLWSFESDGTTFAPKQMLVTGPAVWNVSATKFMVSGDFNNDGYTDVAAMYDYGNGNMGLWSFESNGTTFTPRLMLLTSPAMWNISATRFMVSGDFNADGIVDLAAMYDYGNGKIGIWSFDSNGTVLTPRNMYTGDYKNWNTAATRYVVSGNYNGDSYPDIAATYDYGNGKFGIWSFESNGTNVIPRLIYISNNWEWNTPAIKFMNSGDYNKDGDTDLAIMYDYGNMTMGIWNFNSDGSMMSAKKTFGATGWNVSLTAKIVSGDFGGINQDIFVAMYDYGKNDIGLWGFSPKD